MKSQITRSHSLGDIIIKFQPKSITFNKPKEAKYKLYLEKNVQVISQTIEIIKVAPKNPHYAFVSETSISPFRVATQKLSTYQLTLYQMKLTGEETFVDQAQFSLQKFLRTYYQELQDIEEQLRTKQKSSIIDSWKALSNNFTRKAYNTACKFKVSDAILEFNCTPQTEYDRLVKSQLEKKEKFQTFSIKDNKFLLTKSKTLPELVHQNKFVKKKYHQNDSDVPEIKQSTQIDEKDKKVMTESLKQFKIKIPQVNKQEKQEGKQRKHQSCYQIVEQNEEDIRLQKQEQAYMLKQQHKQGLAYALPSKRSVNEFSIPQTQSLQTKIANLSLNSAIYLEKQSQKKSQTAKKIKQTIITCTLASVYLLSIIFLMHPISKV